MGLDMDQFAEKVRAALALDMEAARALDREAETIKAEALEKIDSASARKAGDLESRAAARKAMVMVAERLDCLDFDAVADAVAARTEREADK